MSGGAERSGTTSATFNLIDDDGDAQPVVSIASDGNVTEGAGTGFTVSSDSTAPAGGLTVNLNVGQMGDYVAAGNLGMKASPDRRGGFLGNLYRGYRRGLRRHGHRRRRSRGRLPGLRFQRQRRGYRQRQRQTALTLSAPAGNIAEASGSKVIKVALGRPLVSGESVTQPVTFGGTKRR